MISRRKCRKIVEERFSRERMVEDYLEVYRKIIDQKRVKCGEWLCNEPYTRGLYNGF